MGELNFPDIGHLQGWCKEGGTNLLVAYVFGMRVLFAIDEAQMSHLGKRQYDVLCS